MALVGVPVAEAMALDGLAAGRHRLLEGRAPAVDGEVALGSELLDALNAEIGDTLALVGGSSVTVTGSVFDPQLASHSSAVVSVDQEGVRVDEWLANTPDTNDATQIADRLLNDGYSVDSRDSWSSDGGETILLFVLGGLALLATGLVAQAAFAVSLRRRQRRARTGGSDWRRCAPPAPHRPRERHRVRRARERRRRGARDGRGLPAPTCSGRLDPC